MAKVKKNTVIKEVTDEGLLADYLIAGWEIVDETKNDKEVKSAKENKNKEDKEVEENKDIVK